MTTDISTSIPASTGPATAARRVGNVALWVLQALLAAVYLMAALPKLTADPALVAGFAALGFPTWAMYTIGMLEVLGAVALLVPRLCGLAGLAFVGLMIGAVTTTVASMGAAMALHPAGVLVLAAVVAWARRRRTAALVAQVRHRFG